MIYTSMYAFIEERLKGGGTNNNNKKKNNNLVAVVGDVWLLNSEHV